MRATMEAVALRARALWERLLPYVARTRGFVMNTMHAQVRFAATCASGSSSRFTWRCCRFMQPNARVVASGGALMTSKCWARMFSDAMGEQSPRARNSAMIFVFVFLLRKCGNIRLFPHGALMALSLPLCEPRLLFFCHCKPDAVTARWLVLCLTRAPGVAITVCGDNKEASIMGVVSQCVTHHRLSAAASSGMQRGENCKSRR